MGVGVDAAAVATGEVRSGNRWPFGDLGMFRYGAILADPPWQMAMYSDKGRGRCPDGRATNERGNMVGGANNDPARHYETMSLADIKALPVNHLAAKDCALFLWAVDPMLPQALEVGAAWGFQFKTIAFYWAKTRREGSTRGRNLEGWDRHFPMGTGYWTRANPEMCLLFTRGAPKRLSAGVRKLLVEPRREHSRKPDRVHDDIEALCSGPYAELFGRAQRPGWDVWGNQADRFEVAA